MVYKDPVKRKEYLKQLKKNNPDKVRITNQKYQQKHKEKYREYKQKWRILNHERLTDYRRQNIIKNWRSCDYVICPNCGQVGYMRSSDSYNRKTKTHYPTNYDVGHKIKNTYTYCFLGQSKKND